jgi:ATP synthase protein I
MLRATLKRTAGDRWPGREVAMARSERPDETGKTGPGETERQFRDDDLERRRRALEASLATRPTERRNGDEGAKPGGTAGYGRH